MFSFSEKETRKAPPKPGGPRSGETTEVTGQARVLKSCLALFDPVDCSLPDFSVPGTSQTRIMEWVSISCSRGSSRPRDPTLVSCIGRQVLYQRTTTRSNETAKEEAVKSKDKQPDHHRRKLYLGRQEVGKSNTDNGL